MPTLAIVVHVHAHHSEWIWQRHGTAVCVLYCNTHAADGLLVRRLDLRDIRVVTKLGGTVDDSEMVEGMVFDQKAAKAAGGPTRVENAKVALVQFHISPPKTDIENNVIISDYAQVCLMHCWCISRDGMLHGC